MISSKSYLNKSKYINGQFYFHGDPDFCFVDPSLDFLILGNSDMSFLYGGIACMVAAFVTHPIDSIKVRLQLQDKRNVTKYKGLVRGIATIVREEGLVGLYRGLSASLLREGTYSTIRIALYQPIKDLIRDPNEKYEPLYKKILAGSISGVIGAGMNHMIYSLKFSNC